jgi:hypothetical protein
MDGAQRRAGLAGQWRLLAGDAPRSSAPGAPSISARSPGVIACADRGLDGTSPTLT